MIRGAKVGAVFRIAPGDKELEAFHIPVTRLFDLPPKKCGVDPQRRGGRLKIECR